jgi:hypothetical protein
MAFENDLKKIDSRDWNVLRSKWLKYLPTISPPGQVPSEEVCELIVIDEIATLAAPAPGSQTRKEVAHLRSEIFREGIFLFHKASNVNGGGLFHVDNGMLSWSVSSAYHSSFFALKSLLSLLGLSFPIVKSRQNKCLMIDCFPEDEKLSKNQIKKGVQPQPELKFVLMQDIGHQHYWEILQRVLRVSNVPLWDDDIVKCLLNFDSEDYTFQRNSIHYINNYWLILEDLFEKKTDLNFALFGDLKTTLSTIKKDSLDYTFFVSYVLLNFTYLLIKDLTEAAPILADEFKLINSCLQVAGNERMIKSLQF